MWKIAGIQQDKGHVWAVGTSGMGSEDVAYPHGCEPVLVLLKPKVPQDPLLQALTVGVGDR